MEAVFADSSCIHAWMQLVRKVSWTFPGLETEASIMEHEQTVLKFMGKRQALCVQHRGAIIGVLLFQLLALLELALHLLEIVVLQALLCFLHVLVVSIGN